MVRIGFILEQALGHVTHTQNLLANVPADAEVQAYWGLVPWEVRGAGAKLPLYRSNWTVRAGLRARRLLRGLARDAVRDGGPLDVLFFHTQVPAVLAADWLRRMPGVVSLDATPVQYDALGEFYGHAAGPAALERTKRRLNQDCFHAARRLVAWTAWTKRSLVDDYGVPADKVTVIPPGVNTAAWRRPTPRTPHGGPVKVLFVGAALERKGGKVLLNAFRQLKAEAGAVPELELHLVTRDAVAPEPGLLVYSDIGPNSDRLKRLYHESDIFCLPTYGDCLPMVLSEAGAAGLPVVTTDVAGIPEIVADPATAGGEGTGLLVPRGDAGALAEALRRLMCDETLRLRMGERAVQKVAAEFDAPTNTARLLDLLKAEAHA